MKCFQTHISVNYFRDIREESFQTSRHVPPITCIPRWGTLPLERPVEWNSASPIVLVGPGGHVALDLTL